MLPASKGLYAAAEFILNAGLRRAFENEELSPHVIEAFLDESRSEGISLDIDTLEYALRGRLERMVERLSENPTELALFEKSKEAVGMLCSLPFQVNLWKVQNVFYDLLQTVYPKLREKAHQSDENSRKWVAHFRALGQKLSVRVE